MPRLCAISICPNHKNAIETVHRFPADHQSHKRKTWEEFAVLASGGKRNISFDYYGICSKHFNESDYQDLNTKRLKATAIPTNLLSPSQPISTGEQAIQEPYQAHALVFKLERQLADLQNENLDLKSQVKKLQLEVKEGEKAKRQLMSILNRYTPGIQKMLLDENKNFTHWTNEDLNAALKIYNISPKAYDHVRENLLPLPAPAHLRRQLAKMVIQPEKPIQSVFSLLNANFIEENYHSHQTTCVIALDEMSIDARYVYDQNLDQVFGGAKNVTLYCARGLFANWKQPLMYSFNTSKEHLIDLIKLLYENGVKVVGIVSDLGPKNVKMWKQFGIGKVEKGIVQSTSFPHPIKPERPVFWIPDFPHLFKRLRDHMLDSFITLPGGTRLDRTWLQELIMKQRSELKLTFKLSLRNLYQRGQERQNVSTAYQVFSRTVASSIRLIMKNHEGFEEVADFFELMNDLSDVFNSRRACDNNNPYKAAYGLYLEEQENLLNKAAEMITNVRIGARKTKTYAPFQKGFLMLIKSTKELFDDLRSTNPEVKYLMLSHLNQDFLENVFSVIRSFGGFDANPNGVQFKYRLRKLVLMWNLSNKNDLSVNYDTLFQQISSNFVSDVFRDCPASAKEYADDIQQQLLYVDPNVDLVKDFDYEEMNEDNLILEGSQEYIAGYISSRLRTSHPELSADLMDAQRREFWIARLSKGGLIEPSNVWFAYFKKFEDYFHAINPSTSIDLDSGVVKKLSLCLTEKYPEVPIEVINFYSRCRIFIRIKYLNKLTEDEKYVRDHQRYQAQLEDDICEEIHDDVEQLSSAGEDILAELLKF